VLLPLDPVEQSVVRRKDPVREQVARALPAVGVARDRSPRSALELPLTGEELLVDRAGQPAVTTLSRDLAGDAELLLVLAPCHRQSRVDLRVLVPRSDQHPLDSPLL